MSEDHRWRAVIKNMAKSACLMSAEIGPEVASVAERERRRASLPPGPVPLVERREADAHGDLPEGGGLGARIREGCREWVRGAGEMDDIDLVTDLPNALQKH